jgi:hypothetical protein
MSQAGFTPIQLYRTTTAAAAPSAGNLAAGELAINIADADMALYAKNNTGVVKRMMNNPAGLKYPNADGTANQAIVTNGSGVLGFVDMSGGISYVVKTANYTALNKQGVLADTTGGAFTVTLPASPVAGDQVVVADSGGVWGTNNLTIGRNGSTIADSATDLVCDISSISVQLVYSGTTWDVFAQVGGTGGTAVTEAGTQTLTNKTISYASNTLTGVVGITATQTLTNKTLTNPTITNYTETPYVANSSTAITLDLNNGTVQIITLTGNATITMPTAVSGKSFIMFLKQDATGSRTVTWSTVKWPGGTNPTITSTASRQDIYSFFSDGTNWYGVTVSQNYTP